MTQCKTRQYPFGGNASNDIKRQLSAQYSTLVINMNPFSPTMFNNFQSDTQTPNRLPSINTQLDCRETSTTQNPQSSWQIPVNIPFSISGHPFFLSSPGSGKPLRRFIPSHADWAPRRCRTYSWAQTSRPRCRPGAARNIHPQKSPPGTLKPNGWVREWWLAPKKTKRGLHRVTGDHVDVLFCFVAELIDDDAAGFKKQCLKQIGCSRCSMKLRTKLG